MAALSGAQIAQIAYQAGFRGQDLVNMVAIAKRESGFQPSAHRTDNDPSAMTGDMGLWQINSGNWSAVSRALGLTSKQQLFDPLVNARAAKWLFDQGGYSPWGMGPNGWTQGGDPFLRTNRNEAQQFVQQASDQGLLGANWSGQSGTPYSAPTTGQAFEGGKVKIPSDMKVIQNQYGLFAVHEIAAGQYISYWIPWDTGQVEWDPKQVVNDKDGKILREGTFVDAGSALELGTVSAAFGGFKDFWDSIVVTVIGRNNPAVNDPGVMKVLAEFAARPDMSEAELQNRLRETQWYQDRTQAELEWNSLSAAERERRRADTAARMADTYFQFAGERLNTSDPRIQNHLEDVASGKMGYGAFTELVKDMALDNAESPWSRQVRDEDEAQRQRPIDIENTSQRIREATERWGLQWSPQTIRTWAKQIVEKKKSDEDLIMQLRNEAKVIYPWKDPEVETATAAAPWLETYRRTMEKTATVNSSDVQRALQAGQTPWEFEQELKKSDGWLGTRNGQESMTAIASEMGRRLGFVS